MKTTDFKMVYDVSIVIPSKDRHESMVRTLNHLLSHLPNGDNIEIIVIEETDNPQLVIEKRVKYHSIPERGLGLGFARNMGLKKASGSIVIFIDDDVLPAEDWFEKLLEPFRDKEVGAVGGAVFPDSTDINTIGKCISFLGFPAGGIKRYFQTNSKNYETSLLSTGNCAFRSELAKHIGGFDALLRWCGEDQDFFFRISSICKTLFVPEAVVFHRQRDSLKRVFLWFSRRGKGEFVMKSKRTSPFLALISPLRDNFLIKVLGFIAIFLVLLSTSPSAALLFFLITYITWNTILWQREYNYFKKSFKSTSNSRLFSIQDSITSKKVAITLPIVKFCMDMGREIGRIFSFFRYIYHRIFCKPIILIFHHIAPSQDQIGVVDPMYYCSKETLEQILDDSERKGWWVVPLTEILTRLKECPRSLYFEKMLSVTFDDGYISTYDVLKEILSRRKYPFTVFLPTKLAARSNTCERPNAKMRERIMTWDQIKALNEMGLEIGSHTRNHVNLLEIPEKNMIEEIRGSLEDLKQELPANDFKKIVFSYPYGAYDQDVAKAVKEAGYYGAVGNFKGSIRSKADPWQIPRFTVFAKTDWANTRHVAYSLWLKELIKDIRDLVLR